MIANRVDANQSEIVDALRKIGASVQPLNAVKCGCPDLLVGYRGVNFVIEIKDGRKPPSARQLTRDEQDWHATWRGTVYIVYSALDAVNLVTHMTLNYDAVLPFGEIQP